MPRSFRARRIGERAVVPDRSESKGVQKEHVRMVPTKVGLQPIMINKGVERRWLQPVMRPLVPRAWKDTSVLKRIIPVAEDRVSLPKAVQPVSIMRWYNVLQPVDKTKLLPGPALLNALKRKGVDLKPGENIYSSIDAWGFEPTGDLYDAALGVVKPDGELDTIPFFLDGGAVGQKFIKDVESLIASKNPIIIKEEESDGEVSGLTPNDMLTYIMGGPLPPDREKLIQRGLFNRRIRVIFDPDGNPFAWLFGVRKLEYVKNVKTGEKYYPPNQDVMIREKLPGGQVGVRRVDQYGRISKFRLYENEKSFREAWLSRMKSPVNVFGEPFFVQSKIDDFTGGKVILDPDDVFSSWRKNVSAKLLPGARVVERGILPDGRFYEYVDGPDYVFGPGVRHHIVTVLSLFRNKIPVVSEGSGFMNSGEAWAYIMRLKNE